MGKRVLGRRSWSDRQESHARQSWAVAVRTLRSELRGLYPADADAQEIRFGGSLQVSTEDMRLGREALGMGDSQKSSTV